MLRAAIAAAMLALCACLPEIRVGPNEGIPPIVGATEISAEALVCGEPIATGTGTTTTSRKVPGGCELTISEELQVLDEPDYEKISNLTTFSGLLEAVELLVTAFQFIDLTTNEPLDLQTRISAATLSVNGQKVAEKATLLVLPQTVRVEGEALQPLKDAIWQRQPASLKVEAVVVLPDDPPAPKGLRFEYQAQPTLVLGGGL